MTPISFPNPICPSKNRFLWAASLNRLIIRISNRKVRCLPSRCMMIGWRMFCLNLLDQSDQRATLTLRMLMQSRPSFPGRQLPSHFSAEYVIHTLYKLLSRVCTNTSRDNFPVTVQEVICFVKFYVMFYIYIYRQLYTFLHVCYVCHNIYIASHIWYILSNFLTRFYVTGGRVRSVLFIASIHLVIRGTSPHQSCVSNCFCVCRAERQGNALFPYPPALLRWLCVATTHNLFYPPMLCTN